MPIDNTTTHLVLPLPYPENDLEDDVLRIIAAFIALDTVIYGTMLQLESKADAEAISGMLAAGLNLADIADKADARENLGLGSVDNTPDAQKPVSDAAQALFNAQQEALDQLNADVSDIDAKKQPTTLEAGTTVGVPTLADNGRRIVRTASFALPMADQFPPGGNFLVDNSSAAAITITAPEGTTMRLVNGTSKASVSLAANGSAVVLYKTASECVIGGGVN